MRAKALPSQFRRHKRKVLAMAKGFLGRRKNCYSLAVRSVHKALTHSYHGRKVKKRVMRQMWVTRIGIAVREHGMVYSRFMQQLQMCHIQLNRKVLSELAIHEPRTFQAITELALQRRNEGLLGALCRPDKTEDLIIRSRVLPPRRLGAPKETAV